MDKNKTDLTERLQEGLKKAYQKMLDFKRKNNSEIVVMQGDKIVKIKP